MKNYKSLDEDIEAIIDSVNPEQINLKSFDEKSILCPKIWTSKCILKKVIRKTLQEIANDFVESLDMNIVPDDVVIVGSIAGYNWSKYSDVDLHIMVDISKLSDYGSEETIKKLFDLSVNEWKGKHSILVFGYPVEIYIQDINDENISDGIYSIKYNKWNHIPKGGNILTDKKLIKTQASQYINIIDKIEELSQTVNTKTKCKILKDEIKRLKDEIADNRRSGLADSGEYNPYNIIFKILRRTGHYGKLRDLKTELSDKIRSLG